MKHSQILHIAYMFILFKLFPSSPLVSNYNLVYNDYMRGHN
jgi:hypothetical protein